MQPDKNLRNNFRHQGVCDCRQHHGAVRGNVMPSKRQVSASQKNAKRIKDAGREKRLFNLKRKREPLVSMDVMRALAASNLPNDPAAYTAKLNELLEA
jgi:hypothetical protein